VCGLQAGETLVRTVGNQFVSGDCGQIIMVVRAGVRPVLRLIDAEENICVG
jgi:hypothetical protein